MFKKFLAVVLAVVMIAGTNLVPVYAAMEDEIFTLSQAERQRKAEEIIHFVEAQQTAQIVPALSGDVYVVKELTCSIIKNEQDPVKQLGLIKSWFAKYPDQSQETINALKKILSSSLVFNWDCEYRARLFQIMCRSLGIPCVCISGVVSYDRHNAARHAWNLAQIDGVWYMFDPSTFFLRDSRLVFMRECDNVVDINGASLYMWSEVFYATRPAFNTKPYWNVSDYAMDGILEAYYKGLTYDYYFDRVDHKSPISRAEFAGCGNNLICQIEDVLWVDLVDQYGSQGADFEDTTDPEVKLANALGFVSGVGNNKFNPNGKITRQEAATMLMRIGQKYGLEPTSERIAFSDVVADSWAKEGIDYVSSLGIMSGVGDGKFDPNGLYTYEQTILTVLRLYNAICE